MEKAKRQPPTSDHFELIQIAAGAWAAIASPDGAAFSNAGIVDLGDLTLVFDTFETPVAARDLKAAGESLTGRPVTFVANRHAHADHWCGSQVFAGQTPIISTHATCAEMPQDTAWLMESKDNPAELTQDIEEERAVLREETETRRMGSLEASIARMTGWLGGLASLELFLPDVTFEGRLVFQGSRRSAELVEVSPAHTSNDAYLVLPEDKIMFMGDLGLFQSQPFMVYCEPLAWETQLVNMERSGIEIFVPGHGPVGSRDDIALQRQYIVLREQLVARVIGDGGTPDDAKNEPVPPPFDAWLHGSMGRWEANVESTYERLSA